MRIIVTVVGLYKSSMLANDAINKSRLFIRERREGGEGSNSVDDGQNPVYVTN